MIRSCKAVLAALLLLVLAQTAAHATASGATPCSGGGFQISTNWQNNTCPDVNEEMANANNRGIIRLTSVAGTNDYTANAAPFALTAYVDGQHFTLKVPNANTTTGRLNVNGLGLKAIVKQNGTALSSGDLATSTIYLVQYVGGADDQFRVMGAVGTPGVDDDIPDAGSDYANLVGGTGIVNSPVGTIAFDFSDKGASPALSVDQCVFTSNATTAGYIVCEGDTADTFESRIAFADPTADRLMTVPNANSNPVQPLTCGGTDKISGISSAGVVTCAADQVGGGVSDADYGDISVVAGVWTIDVGVVTSGKILDGTIANGDLANMANATFKCRNTAGSGAPEDCTASQVRSLLALVIGTNVQAWDADLDTWAGVTPSANGQSLVSAANYAAMRALLDLEAGTDFYSIAAADAAFQPLDSDLTTWAGVTSSANGRSLVSAANYAAMRALLDLEAGTDFNAFSARLADIAGITWNQGDILYYNGSNLVDLGPGTNGQFLKTQGAGANPVWADAPGAGGGADVFTDLNDVPASYSGAGGRCVKVTAGEDGLEFVACAGGGSMDDFTLAGDAGTPQTIADGNTLTVAGSTGVSTAAGATDTLTITLDSDLQSWAGVTRASGFDTFTATPSSGNFASLVTGETGSGALVLGTDPDISISATTESNIEAAIDTLSNLTSIQGRTITLTDDNLDVLAGWDDSDGAYESLSLAEIATEASPAAGDFLLIYGAEGDLRKVDWSGLPGGGGDSITVNTTAVTDPDFDNAAPAAPAGGYNVKWQTSSNDMSAYIDFTGATDLTSPDVADSILVNDDSASDAIREVLLSDLFKVTNALTEDTAPAVTADFVPTYDTSATSAKKVLLSRIGVGKTVVPLPAGSGTTPSGGGIASCTMINAFDSGSNDIFMKQCSFSAGTDNAIYYYIPAPKAANETVDWTVRVDWTSATTTDGSDNVIWTAAAVCWSNDDSLNGNAFPTVDTVTDTQTAAGDFLSTSEITAITPAGTWAENDGCVLRITRDADAGGDNFNGTAELLNVMLYITTNANTED